MSYFWSSGHDDPDSVMEYHLNNLLVNNPGPHSKIDFHLEKDHNLFPVPGHQPLDPDVKDNVQPTVIAENLNKIHQFFVTNNALTEDCEFTFHILGQPKSVRPALNKWNDHMLYFDNLESAVSSFKFDVKFSNLVYTTMVEGYGDQTFDWQPGLPPGLIFGKSKSFRVQVFKVLHKLLPDLIYSIPKHPSSKLDWVWDWNNFVSPEIIAGSQSDPDLMNWTPTGYEYPKYMYDNMSVEIINETWPDRYYEFYLTEKTLRPLYMGMPHFGSRLDYDQSKALGFLSYYDLVDIELPREDLCTGTPNGHLNHAKFTQQWTVPAVNIFCKKCRDTGFQNQVRETIRHNKTVAQNYLNANL